MNCTVIGIAGGTGSGKSTFTNRIKSDFGDEIVIIYHDNYYKCQDDIPFEKRTKINYDHPDAIETELLIKHIKMLKRGYSVECPIYDYVQHNRSTKTITLQPKRVIVIEGILVLQSLALRKLLDIGIYVEAAADERIMRRAIRDIKERGRDLESIFEQYLTTVRPMHDIYVEPTKRTADIVINSGMNDVAFDIIKTKIEQLLKE